MRAQTCFKCFVWTPHLFSCTSQPRERQKPVIPWTFNASGFQLKPSPSGFKNALMFKSEFSARQTTPDRSLSSCWSLLSEVSCTWSATTWSSCKTNSSGDCWLCFSHLRWCRDRCGITSEARHSCTRLRTVEFPISMDHPKVSWCLRRTSWWFLVSFNILQIEFPRINRFYSRCTCRCRHDSLDGVGKSNWHAKGQVDGHRWTRVCCRFLFSPFISLQSKGARLPLQFPVQIRSVLWLKQNSKDKTFRAIWKPTRAFIDDNSAHFEWNFLCVNLNGSTFLFIWNRVKKSTIKFSTPNECWFD